MAGFAHLGIGFAAKRFAPKVPLGILLVCSMGLDLLSILFMLIGVESSGNTPWSHGMMMSFIISAAVFGVLALITKKIRVSIVISLVVFSHWILDFITWPMTVGDPSAEGVPVFFDNSFKIGLGTHQTLAGALITESVFVITGVIIYIITLKKILKDKKLVLIDT